MLCSHHAWPWRCPLVRSELTNLLGSAWPAGVVVTLLGPGISGTNHKIKLSKEMASGPGGRLECRVRSGLYHEIYDANRDTGSSSTAASHMVAAAAATAHRARWKWRRLNTTKARRSGGSADEPVEAPHLAVLFNAGVHSPELIADWAPTLELLLKAEVPVVITAFDEGEAARAEMVLTRPTAAAARSGSAGGRRRLDLRAQLVFGPELNKWGSLLRSSHPGQPLYTLQSLFGNSRCWFGVKGARDSSEPPPLTSSSTTAWLQSDMGRDWLSLVSG